MAHRATRTELRELGQLIQSQAIALGMLAPGETLTVQMGGPSTNVSYRLLRDGGSRGFITTGDGWIGETSREAYLKLTAIRDTLYAVKYSRD